MDVVQSNFEEVVALLEATLPRTEFISVDCEMTGIRGRPEMWLDSPQHRYGKLKFIASKYRLIQVGVALFYREAEELKVLPLNFYVFPRDPNANIVLEVGAVAFNRRNDMDFNKWIYEGIHYIDEYAEDMLHTRVYGADNSTEITLIRQSDIEMFREINAKVHRWLESDETELELTSLNAFHRKYFYQRVVKDFPNITSETCGDSKCPVLKLKKESAESQAELKEERQRLRMQEALGFRRVFKLLITAKKPLLGHNLLVDLLFIYSSFQGKLPAELPDFQAMVHADFPEIYDTRHMYLSIPGFRQQHETERTGGSLTEIHNYLKQTVQVKLTLAAGCERYTGAKAHEAAYDAYITGEVFLMLKTLIPDSVMYRNHLTLYRSLFTINLEGGFGLPDGPVWVIKGFGLETLEGFNVKKFGDSIAFLHLEADQEVPLDLLRSKNIEIADLESQLLNDEPAKGTD